MSGMETAGQKQVMEQASGYGLSYSAQTDVADTCMVLHWF